MKCDGKTGITLGLQPLGKLDARKGLKIRLQQAGRCWTFAHQRVLERALLTVIAFPLFFLGLRGPHVAQASLKL